MTKFRNVCAHGERLYSFTTRDDIPDLPLHQKLNIQKKGQQYLYGKRDLFALMIALRYLLPSSEFGSLKKSCLTGNPDFQQQMSVPGIRSTAAGNGIPRKLEAYHSLSPLRHYPFLADKCIYRNLD